MMPLPLEPGREYPYRYIVQCIEVYCLLNSQKKCAAKIGISPQYLSDILHGRREISGSLATKLGLVKMVGFKCEEPA